MFLLNPLNILVIIILCFVLFTTLGSYKEGFGDKSININGLEIKNTSFIGKDGNTAKIVNDNGSYYIILTDNSGNNTKYTFSPNNSDSFVSSSVQSYDSPTSTNFMNNSYKKIIFNGPNNSIAEIINLNGTIIIQIQYSNGDIGTFTQTDSSNDNSSNDNSSNDNSSYPSFYPNQASYSSNYYQSLYSNPSSMYSNSSSNSSSNYPFKKNSNFDNEYDYSSSLPPAIPASQIPAGQEDLYILKSVIVPPVCPAPVNSCNQKTDTCAPCPPCGRCPEPKFECKKVPSYSPDNPDLPQPLITPYSTYGT